MNKEQRDAERVRFEAWAESRAWKPLRWEPEDKMPKDYVLRVVNEAWDAWQARALLSDAAQQEPRIDYRAECWPESPHHKAAAPAAQPATPDAGHDMAEERAAFDAWRKDQPDGYDAWDAWQQALSRVQAVRKPLTEKRIEELWGEFMSARGSGYVPDFVRSIEQAHGITGEQQ